MKKIRQKLLDDLEEFPTNFYRHIFDEILKKLIVKTQSTIPLGNFLTKMIASGKYLDKNSAVFRRTKFCWELLKKYILLEIL